MMPINTTPSPDNKWDDCEFHQQPRNRWLQRHRRETGLFVGLGAILLLVIFWLPTVISPTTPPSYPAAEVSSNTPLSQSQTASNSSELTTTESPWQDAQLAKARREAQEILAKLLDQQHNLEAMQVRLWAQTAFERAIATATDGDQQYRQRQFDAAQQQYQSALTQFENLLKQAGDQFQQALEEGLQAITKQDSTVAISAFELATAIRPNNQEARASLQRAQVLTQVLELLEQADNQVLLQQLDEAKQNIDAALQLDAQSQPAQQQRVHIQQAIANRDYASFMGQGYSALDNQDYPKAIRRFKHALAIKPSNQAARTAITQTNNKQTQAHIQLSLKQAQTLEASEQWQQAVEHYQAAQALDNSLVTARVGVLRSQARANLDQQLQRLIDEPLRLADPSVYRRAQQQLSDAHAVRPQGKRIQQQAQRLELALKKARNPIAVLLRSDNETQVTLYKNGTLGNFTEHTLQLKPGRYTAVGSRKGYRDVREEFTVQPGANSQTVVIQCDEKISLDG